MWSSRVGPLLALSASLFGCGHAPKLAALPPAAATAKVALPNATGTWEWVFRSSDDQGNIRLEQEEWHLEQHGPSVRGFYDRLVTMTSTDDKLFRCNQQLGFTKATRVQVVGIADGQKVVLQEVGFEAKPGPCDDGARSLVNYVGRLNGPTIELEWGRDPSGDKLTQTLFRAEAGRATQLAEVSTPLPVEAAMQRSLLGQGAPLASVPVEGTWEWEQKSIDAEGDERIEHEEWHLRETSDDIVGFYERKVIRVRGDGVFVCAAADRYETLTRYTIAGQRRGNRLSLTETKFEVPATPAAKRCDNGQRRLDSYNGTLSSDGDELALSWGPGYQLLRRQR